MAAGEGFEPSHTESESAVLPLHNPAKRKGYYTLFVKIVKKKINRNEKGELLHKSFSPHGIVFAYQA